MLVPKSSAVRLSREPSRARMTKCVCPSWGLILPRENFRLLDRHSWHGLQLEMPLDLPHSLARENNKRAGHSLRSYWSRRNISTNDWVNAGERFRPSSSTKFLRTWE